MNDFIPMSKHHLRESSTLVILRILAAFVISTFIFAAFLIVFLTNNPFYGIDSTIFTIFGVYFILSIFTGALTLFFVISRMSTDYYISESTIVIHTGLFHIEEETYEIKNIYAIKRIQTWLGKIFKYGDIKVNIAASNYQKEIRLIGIQKPKKYEKILAEFIVKQKTPVAEVLTLTK